MVLSIAGKILLHVFVYFACTDFCPSSLPLGVGGWLRLVIVALDFSFNFLYLNIGQEFTVAFYFCIFSRIRCCYFTDPVFSKPFFCQLVSEIHLVGA